MVEISRLSDNPAANSTDKHSPGGTLSQYVNSLFLELAPKTRQGPRELVFGGDFWTNTHALAERPCKGFYELPIDHETTKAVTTTHPETGKPIHRLDLFLTEPAVVEQGDGSKLFFAKTGSADFSVSQSNGVRKLELTDIKGLQGELAQTGVISFLKSRAAGKSYINSATFIRTTGEKGLHTYSITVSGTARGIPVKESRALSEAEFNDLNDRITGYLNTRIASRQ
jgi:hypothetical protein